MNRRDSLLILVLVAALGVAAALVGAPALQPAVAVQTPTPPPIAADTERPYREGVLGHPQSISPLTARTQADRDLVALLFRGLVRNGPNGTLVADLAETWTVGDGGRTWTFTLRQDARWHDGEPLTAEDVVFTIRTLQDPGYEGPRAASWTGVEVKASGVRTVTFTLETPLGGFLQAATQPIAPAHLLGDVPVRLLPDDEFGRDPVGSGWFELVSLTQDLAVLEPLARDAGSGDQTTPEPGPTDAFATPRPTQRPELPEPFVDGIEFHYADDPETLRAAYVAGRVDAVSGVSSEVAASLAQTEDAFLLRYPGSTLTAVLFNLRPGRAGFMAPEARTAFLKAIDRDALIEEAFHGAAVRAETPIPPGSPLHDPTVTEGVAHDPAGAAAALEAKGWKKVDGQWRLPDREEAFSVEVISPDEASSPAVFAAAAAVTRDWRSFGVAATHVPLPAGEFVNDRIAKADFSVAVADLAIGLDPDLYPLLASTQTLTGGSNIIGLQDPTLDPLLVAARKPGSDAQRLAAYSALETQLAKGRYLLPLAFADETVVVHKRVSGPVVRQVADPSDRFWDVLTWRLADDP